MKKFNIETVFNYINGNDIDSFEIEELENNAEFMKNVLSISKDKNMFNLCGDELKKNIDFLKTVVSIFPKDEEFICKTLEEFVDNSENDKETIEISLLALKYVKDKYDRLKFKTLASIIYANSRANIELALNAEDIDRDLFGTGFIVVKDLYAGYDLTIDYFADRMIDEVFENIEDIEVYLHESFKSKEELIEYGVVKFLIDYINFYDKSLADFVAINPNKVKEYKESVQKVIREWDYFEEMNKRNKMEEINNRIIDYFINSESGLMLDIDLFTYYILNQFGLAEEYNKQDYNVDEISFKKIMEKINSGCITYDKFNLNEKVHARNIGKIISEITSERVYQEKDSYLLEEAKKDSIVLSIKNKGKLK